MPRACVVSIMHCSWKTTKKTHFQDNIITETRGAACPRAFELYYGKKPVLERRGINYNLSQNIPIVHFTTRRAFALVAEKYFRYFGPLSRSTTDSPASLVSLKNSNQMLPERYLGEVSLGKVWDIIYELTEEFDYVFSVLEKYQKKHLERHPDNVQAGRDDDHEDHDHGHDQYETPEYQQFTMLPKEYRSDPFEFLGTTYSWDEIRNCSISAEHAAFLVEVFDCNQEGWINEPQAPVIMNMIENLRGILASAGMKDEHGLEYYLM